MRTRKAAVASARGRLEPIRLLELELGTSLSDAAAGQAHNGSGYAHARVLVRLHGAPLGVVEIDLDGVEPTVTSVTARAHREFRAAIDAHLERDGLAGASGLAPASSQPLCVSEREAFIGAAPPASVVIATRERPESLASTLDGVLALEYPTFEVIVVDNAPTSEATREVVARYAAGGKVRYIREPLAGLAVAHNRGLAEAGGEIVAFTDDDVAVDPLWLLELARGFELADDVACVTGLILPAELETPAQVWLEDCVGINKGYEPKLFDLHLHRPPGRLFPYAAGSFGSGANMAFQTETLRALGGFDPATGTGTRARGGDDLAAFFSIVAAGHTLAYQPAAIVRHAYRRDAESLRRQMYDYGAGLGAFLAKVVVDRPGRALDLARRVPFGVAHALGSRPTGRHGTTPAGTGRLATRERLGMLVGPAAYLVERRRRRALYTTRAARAGRRVRQ